MTDRARCAVVTLSIRLYTLLLIAYPRASGAPMGPHMAQAFRDCCRATYQARGGRGLGSLWAITLGDVVTSALAERSARITPLLSHERGSHTHIMAPSHALPLLTPCANQMGVLLHPLALC